MLQGHKIWSYLPFIMVIFCTAYYLGSIRNVKQNAYPKFEKKDSTRQNITFILGEDRPGGTPYYSLAVRYYTTNENAKTEFIITHCKSLLEVRNYLAFNPPTNGNPWGIVNLISHGNEWSGMSVPIAPDAKRSSSKRIHEYISEGKFPCVSDEILDNSSELFLHGCGLGNDQELLLAIADAFGGDGEKPNVIASRLKEYYFQNGSDNSIQLYYAQTWSTSYKFKKRPEFNLLVDEFKQTFSNESINWNDALKYANPISPTDVFHYTINVPVYYDAIYDLESGHPNISTQDEVVKFVKKQNGLKELVQKSNLLIDRFIWNSQRIYIKDELGKSKPAIKLNGWTTVISVVKPLYKQNDNKIEPYYPTKHDTTYFGYINKSIYNF